MARKTKSKNKEFVGSNFFLWLLIIAGLFLLPFGVFLWIIAVIYYGTNKE